MVTHPPRAFPLGDRASRGHRPRYGKSSPSGQRAPTAPTDLPAQRMSTQVPTTALEPTLLPGPGMSTAGPTLASGTTPGEIPPACRRQSPARSGGESSPPASEVQTSDRYKARSCAGAWSRSSNFFSLPLCDRPGCHEHPVDSARNLARYCCPACRQAVRNVRDRERKWLSRGTLDGRKKRIIEYQAACRRRVLRQHPITNSAPSRPPPE